VRPLVRGLHRLPTAGPDASFPGRGLHSFTSELNLSNSRTSSSAKSAYTVDRGAQVELNWERGSAPVRRATRATCTPTWRAVQVHPVKPKLKASGTKILKLQFGTLLSNHAFIFDLRRSDVDYSGHDMIFGHGGRDAAKARHYARGLHSSISLAQNQHCLWDMSNSVRLSVTETAQVELKRGRM